MGTHYTISPKLSALHSMPCSSRVIASATPQGSWASVLPPSLARSGGHGHTGSIATSLSSVSEPSRRPQAGRSLAAQVVPLRPQPALAPGPRRLAPSLVARADRRQTQVHEPPGLRLSRDNLLRHLCPASRHAAHRAHHLASQEPRRTPASRSRLQAHYPAQHDLHRSAFARGGGPHRARPLGRRPHHMGGFQVVRYCNLNEASRLALGVMAGNAYGPAHPW
jgi:hypothetical protein